MNLAYRDQYTGAGDTIGPQSIGHGLRAIVHFPSAKPSTFDLARLIDGQGRGRSPVRRAVRPIRRHRAREQLVRELGAGDGATRVERGGERVGGAESIRLGEGDDLGHGARPVLSSRPGHADGVLLGKDGLVMWVDHTGAVRPVAASQGRGDLQRVRRRARQAVRGERELGGRHPRDRGGDGRRPRPRARRAAVLPPAARARVELPCAPEARLRRPRRARGRAGRVDGRPSRPLRRRAVDRGRPRALLDCRRPTRGACALVEGRDGERRRVPGGPRGLQGRHPDGPSVDHGGRLAGFPLPDARHERDGPLGKGPRLPGGRRGRVRGNRGLRAARRTD